MTRCQSRWVNVIIIALVVILRLPTLLPSLYNSDEGYYGIIANDTLDGGTFYRTAVDTKPPGIYYIYVAVFKVAGKNNLLAVHVLAILVVAAGYFQMSKKPASSPVADTASVALQPHVVSEPFAAAGNSLDQEEKSLGPMQAASLSDASPVDNSLRENLATLNSFIKECRKRLQEDPNDQVARDYLSAAYQQKAQILAAMMERGRSVN